MLTAKLGDASFASSFTSKLPSPQACVDILRQGRCTLVTTHQMYKILAINSLVLSYTMSVLYLHGLKTADSQATVGAIFSVLFSLCMSFSSPVNRLTRERPHSSVFNAPLLLSVLGQFLVHFCGLVLVEQHCTRGLLGGFHEKPADDAFRYETEEQLAVKPFLPTVLNTMAFLLQLCQMACTYFLNYTGLPFMTPLSRSSWLVRGVMACYAVALLCSTGMSPELSTYFQLVPLGESSSNLLTLLICCDFFLCFLWERSIRAVFGVGRLQAK